MCNWNMHITLCPAPVSNSVGGTNRPTHINTVFLWEIKQKQKLKPSFPLSRHLLKPLTLNYIDKLFSPDRYPQLCSFLPFFSPLYECVFTWRVQNSSLADQQQRRRRRQIKKKKKVQTSNERRKGTNRRFESGEHRGGEGGDIGGSV